MRHVFPPHCPSNADLEAVKHSSFCLNLNLRSLHTPLFRKLLLSKQTQTTLHAQTEKIQHSQPETTRLHVVYATGAESCSLPRKHREAFRER